MVYLWWWSVVVSIHVPRCRIESNQTKKKTTGVVGSTVITHGITWGIAIVPFSSSSSSSIGILWRTLKINVLLLLPLYLLIVDVISSGHNSASVDARLDACDVAVMFSIAGILLMGHLDLVKESGVTHLSSRTVSLQEGHLIPSEPCGTVVVISQTGLAGVEDFKDGDLLVEELGCNHLPLRVELAVAPVGPGVPHLRPVPQGCFQVEVGVPHHPVLQEVLPRLGLGCPTAHFLLGRSMGSLTIVLHSLCSTLYIQVGDTNIYNCHTHYILHVHLTTLSFDSH